MPSPPSNFCNVVNTTPPDATLQGFLQVIPALRLDWFLPQQFAVGTEGAEELIVEVVAIRDDNQRRVLHRRMLDNLPAVKGHREALARPLRVPDDANAPVSAGLSTASTVQPTALVDRPVLVIGAAFLAIVLPSSSNVMKFST